MLLPPLGPWRQSRCVRESPVDYSAVVVTLVASTDPSADGSDRVSPCVAMLEGVPKQEHLRVLGEALRPKVDKLGHPEMVAQEVMRLCLKSPKEEIFQLIDFQEELDWKAKDCVAKLRSKGFFAKAIFRNELKDKRPVWAPATLVRIEDRDRIYSAESDDGPGRSSYDPHRRPGERGGGAHVDLTVHLEPESAAMECLQQQYKELLAMVAALRSEDPGGRLVGQADMHLRRHPLSSAAEACTIPFDLRTDIPEHVVPVNTHLRDRLAGLEVSESVEVLIEAPPEVNDRGQPRRDPRARPKPAKWVIGTVLKRLNWSGSGSEILEVALPAELMPSAAQLDQMDSAAARRHAEMMRYGMSSDRSRQHGAKIQAELQSEGQPVVCIDVGTADFRSRARVAQHLAVQSPEALVDLMVQVEPQQQGSSYSRPSYEREQMSRTNRPMKVLAWLPQLGQHLLQPEGGSNTSVELADLTTRRFTTTACKQRLEPRQMLAPLGTHTRECLACTERNDVGEMATFCFEHYRVTGDSSEKRGARHAAELCKTCFAGYCGREIDAGKLSVKCPSCPRALQTRELQFVVESKQYERLVKRIRDAERAHGDDSADGEMLAAGLEIRLCPKCDTRIEKNEGCPSMDCYLCGHKFDWKSAKKLKKVRGEAFSVATSRR